MRADTTTASERSRSAAANNSTSSSPATAKTSADMPNSGSLLKKQSEDSGSDAGHVSGRTIEPNYISDTIAYALVALHPAIVQWRSWTHVQRFLASVIGLCIFFVPMIVAVMFVPWLLLLASLIYIGYFGFDRFAANLSEALSHHFGLENKSLLIDRANLYCLKRKAEGHLISGHQWALSCISRVSSQAVRITVVGLDYAISGLLRCANTLKETYPSEGSPAQNGVRSKAAL